MDHFTVVSLVTWPWIVSEAGVNFVLIETSLLSYVNHAVLMLTSLYLHKKAVRFLLKQGQPQPRFQSKPGHQAHNCKMAY